MNTNSVKRVVIAGGGTAGWLAAAAISKLLGRYLQITLVESDEIGTIGVGEATIPTMLAFHRLLGINEQEFLRAVNGTFKLGISFENWRDLETSYTHPFGKIGQECWAGEFHHFWLRGRELGIDIPYCDYSFERKTAQKNKFSITQDPFLHYAYHLDATLYAKYLRNFSEGFGVQRKEGKINEVTIDPEKGFIGALVLQSGEIIEGDLFIDCTGFRGLLIEQALQTGYEDWSHWLPCDSAAAVQTESVGPPIPYTRAMAQDVGWQWRIPLQNRVGNGLVYCSRFCSDDDAKLRLLNNIEGKPITEPRVIKFRTGRRKKGWNKNCIALGLASGFIEPLESTSIHLVTSGLVRLLRLFPIGGIKQVEVDEYNRQSDAEIECVRDFIILHYHATQRNDSEFWQYCRAMDVPKTLAHRLKLFKETGRIFVATDELFSTDSWLQVMLGQGIVPQEYHPVANQMSDQELTQYLLGFQKHIDKNVSMLSSHEDFIMRYCEKTA